jgi:hypothetical protein
MPALKTTYRVDRVIAPGFPILMGLDVELDLKTVLIFRSGAHEEQFPLSNC